jgi:hypothetical protein
VWYDSKPFYGCLDWILFAQLMHGQIAVFVNLGITGVVAVMLFFTNRTAVFIDVEQPAGQLHHFVVGVLTVVIVTC